MKEVKGRDFDLYDRGHEKNFSTFLEIEFDFVALFQVSNARQMYKGSYTCGERVIFDAK